jgi:DSF synthase
LLSAPTSSPSPAFTFFSPGPRAAEAPDRRDLRVAAEAPPQPHYAELDLTLDREDTLWCFMRPHGPPSYTPSLLGELAEMQASIKRAFATAQIGKPPIQHFVLGSRLPGIFNLGGDLRLFAQCIRGGDRERLAAYAFACIDVLYNNYVAFNLPVITVALVQGDALGGGFESALACDMIVAEKSVKFGLPEILFGLFPGMGAFSLLSRKLDAARAERLMLSGRIYGADELHQMGLIEVLAEDGQGEEALRDHLARNARRRHAQHSVFQMRRRIFPLAFEELRDVTGMWVDAALKLTESDLRKMERLSAAQLRRITKTHAAE